MLSFLLPLWEWSETKHHSMHFLPQMSPTRILIACGSQRTHTHTHAANHLIGVCCSKPESIPTVLFASSRSHASNSLCVCLVCLYWGWNSFGPLGCTHPLHPPCCPAIKAYYPVKETSPTVSDCSVCSSLICLSQELRLSLVDYLCHLGLFTHVLLGVV